MENKNKGVIISKPRPTDYILGATSKIKVERKVDDWSIYLPLKESQRNNVTDFLDCVTMSGPDHSIGTQLNYLLATNQLPDEALNFFKDGGYIQNGVFSLSSRFNAKLNQTEQKQGNELNNVAECVRRDGFISEKDWPTTENMSWSEFYRDIPIGLFSKGRKALWFINIQYQWVLDTSVISKKLSIAPIQCATAVCAGWNSGKTVQKCSNQPLQHATMLYGKDKDNNWLNLDHYPPFTQLLAPDYELPLNMQYIVTVKPLTLRKGMYGSNVLQLQKDLNKLWYNIKEDGKFGPKTEEVVFNFQRLYNLGYDGIVGKETFDKIKKLLK
jgi:hypothetical protein